MRNLITILCGLLLIGAAFASPAPLSLTTDMAPNAGPVAPKNWIDAQWDLMWSFNVQGVCQDNQLLGVEFANNMFWITGGNNAADPNQLYRLTPAGVMIDSVFQPTLATGWGIRDLAFDGAYVYGGCEATTIFAFDMVTGALVPGMQIPRPAGNTCVRALAYDPATDHFWTGNFAANIIEFDRSGAIIWQGPAPAGCAAIYGMAWDTQYPGSARLWIHNQSPNPAGPLGCTFFEFNPVTHLLTGVSYTVPLLPGTTSQIAGGADMDNQYSTSFWTIYGLAQGTPNDMIFVLEMCPQGPTVPVWDINTFPTAPPVVIPPGGGSFPYSINVHNLTTVTHTVYVTNKVRTAANVYYTVFGPINRTLVGSANPTRILTQTIAGSIPAGTLTFISYAGQSATSYDDSSLFTITKNPLGDAGPWISESYVTGDFFDEYATGTATPSDFAVITNYPNPFNPITNISYTLANAGNVKLSVFDATGREVATLVNGYRDAGMHNVTFDGAGLASGIYLYRLNTGDQVTSGKMVLMK